MSVKVNAVYDGGLHCTVEHEPSRAKIVTDAPLDNGGKGGLFSPTDLVAAAAGTCILTVMGLVARRGNLDIAGARVSVVKEMVSVPARRIGSLKVAVTLPAALKPEDRRKLEETARHCPVHQSLHPGIAVEMRFEYV